MTTKKLFIIGFNDQNTLKQIIDDDAIVKIVREIASKSFEYGCTLTMCDGVYKHHDGRITIEKSVQVVAYTDEDHIGFIDEVKIKLNQETVLYEQSQVDLSFL